MGVASDTIITLSTTSATTIVFMMWWGRLSVSVDISSLTEWTATVVLVKWRATTALSAVPGRHEYVSISEVSPMVIGSPASMVL